MKKIKFMLAALLCCLSMTSTAQDYTLYAEDMNITPGTDNLVLNIYMTNVETISALQFDIALPEGVDVYYGENEDEDMVYFINKGDRAKTDHTASYLKQSDRTYRVMISSPTNATFKETEANKTKPVACIRLAVSVDVKEGEANVDLKNIVFAHYIGGDQSQPYYPSDSMSKLIVGTTTSINNKVGRVDDNDFSYSINGSRNSRDSKGINIIKKIDGSTTKYVVK